jgi:uncharacterized protein (DUF305 family)
MLPPGRLTLLLVLAVAACASPGAEGSPSRAVQPGAPGEASRTLTAQERDSAPEERYTEADVRFMQSMIHHHQQAVAMAELVPDRTDRAEIRLLADRIHRSQRDEMALMTRWLASRGEAVPELDQDHGEHGHGTGHVHHDEPGEAHGGHLMAGMLSPEEMERLARARGSEFDRLLLEFMIYHHEGALQMVEELFSSPGAAQGWEIFQFASHVEADQSIEIGRMTRMLESYR